MSEDMISPALVAALGSFDELVRDKTATVPTKAGGQYSYNYSDLASVLGYVRPILAANGLVVMQPVTCDGQMVSVATVLVHESGQSREFPALSLPCGRTPQEVGSATTYGRRYALLSVLGLATEDDDGAAATKATKVKPARRESPPPNPAAGVKADPHAARRRHAMALFGELGLSGDDKRDERLALTSDLAGHPVGSWNDLGPDEADQVIDQLKLRVEEARRVP